MFQYSHYYWFLKKYKLNINYLILHNFGILPISIFSLSFASSKIVEKFQLNRAKVLFFSWIFIFFLFKYEIFIELEGYNGIIHIFASSSFFIFFYLLPLENIYSWIKRIITQLTNYTNGIYCLHFIMISFVRIKLGIFGNINACITIFYIIQYINSFV